MQGDDWDIPRDLFGPSPVRGRKDDRTRDRSVQPAQQSSGEASALKTGAIVCVLAGSSFCSSEAREILKASPEGSKVKLIEEPTNRYDEHTIGVFMHGERVGYIQSEKAAKPPHVGNQALKSMWRDRWPWAVLIRNSAGEYRIKL